MMRRILLIAMFLSTWSVSALTPAGGFWQLFLCSNGIATTRGCGPYISSVTGSISEGSSITIAGVGFGNTGPDIVLFEDFNGLTVGQTITAAVTGFDADSTILPIADADSRSGTIGASAYQLLGTSYYAGAILKRTNITPFTEFFISYAIKVPSGSNFPGEEDTPNTYPDPVRSSWKTAWVTTDDSTTDNDIVPGTWTGYNWQIAGNGTNAQLIMNPTSMFSFGEWNRFSTYIKAGADPDVDVGSIWFENLAPNMVRYTIEDNTQAIFSAAPATQSWNQVNVSGWMDPTPDTTTDFGIKTLYDDIYLAIGANAAARIEIGNNADYTLCTDRALLIPTAWADGSITATVKTGAFGAAPIGPLWLFVVLPDNTTSAAYQVL